MADNSLPLENLSDRGNQPPANQDGQDQASASLAERRAVLRPGALIGLPVVVARIPSRSARAQPKKPGGTGRGGPKKPGGGAEVAPLNAPSAGCLASDRPDGSGCANRVSLI